MFFFKSIHVHYKILKQHRAKSKSRPPQPNHRQRGAAVDTCPPSPPTAGSRQAGRAAGHTAAVPRETLRPRRSIPDLLTLRRRAQRGIFKLQKDTDFSLQESLAFHTPCHEAGRNVYGVSESAMGAALLLHYRDWDSPVPTAAAALSVYDARVPFQFSIFKTIFRSFCLFTYFKMNSSFVGYHL